MTIRRVAKRPLNKQAVKRANDAVRGQTGGRQIQSHETELKKQWMDAYIAAGGEVKEKDGTPPDSPVVPCNNKDREDELPKVDDQKRVTIRLSLFFDGTMNNRVNSLIGKEDAPSGWFGLGSTGSYENDFSNVARLEGNAAGDPRYDFSSTLYIEGIGTENAETDSLIGGATGMGSTGVREKVYKGLQQAIKKIDQWKSQIDDSIIAYLHIDTFGFSRGAAAARYCLQACLFEDDTNLKKRLTDKGYTVETVEAKFVGLFDTVASHGIKHTNDTADLSLRAVQHAKKTVHLAASEEHRVNFRLTDIQSAGNKGIEIFLPGVHSDIGGGYVDNDKEKDLILLELSRIARLFSQTEVENRLQAERDRLIDTGWYTLKEITLGKRSLTVNRTNISNAYSFIPLEIMADFAKEDHLEIIPSLDILYSIPNELDPVRSVLMDYVDAVKQGEPSSPGKWLENTDQLRALRHGYLHSSAHYNGSLGSMDPQFTDDDPMNGERQRITQDG